VISQASGKDMPVLEVIKEDVDPSKGISLWDGSNNAATGDGGAYGDIETKLFYEVLITMYI
jgi:hypothetical protein